MFQVNEGPKDRRNRAILGAAFLVVAAFLLHGWVKLIASVVGLLFIFTAITGFCALYRVFKISTTKKEEKKEEGKV